MKIKTSKEIVEELSALFEEEERFWTNPEPHAEESSHFVYLE